MLTGDDAFEVVELHNPLLAIAAEDRLEVDRLVELTMMLASLTIGDDELELSRLPDPLLVIVADDGLKVDGIEEFTILLVTAVVNDELDRLLDPLLNPLLVTVILANDKLEVFVRLDPLLMIGIVVDDVPGVNELLEI